ncbi:LysM peptidoglycan-binding domain-containing protein [Metabacillus litoralis]|nr:LysM peptidoglycan-binding domain-containing protein [Metabacillus litoralis]
MDIEQKFELRKLDPLKDEFTLVLFLDDQLTEFAVELGRVPKETKSITLTARQIVKERYPNLKVTMVKVVLGGLVVASIPLSSKTSSVQAEELDGTTQIEQGNTIFYQVSSGDTLWNLSVRYGTSVDYIRQANHLSSDVLQLNQRLIIPKTIHTVATGDYLTVLAKKYGTTVAAIKEANNLANDTTRLGQKLIIPILIGANTNETNQPITQQPTQSHATTYSVVSGDSLSVIAKRFGTTVEALRSANHLTTDLLRIGQTIVIPSSGNNVTDTIPNPAPTQDTTTSGIKYTVVAGDSLWGIASRYHISLDEIRSSNNLETDQLKIGQTLIIPKDGEGATAPSVSPAPTTNPKSTSYTIVSGDSLSVIAKRFDTTVEQIKQVNQLTSDTIRVGQVLSIPNAQGASNGETALPPTAVNTSLQTVQKNLQTLGYYAVPTMTGSYDTATTQAIKTFQGDYGLSVTGKVDQATNTAIEHAIVKKTLIKDTKNYLGVPYQWGGTSPSGFDCSGFVYYMFNQHGIDSSRNTSAGLYKTGTAIAKNQLQPGDLVFFAVNTTGTITHVGFYMGDNQFISATSSKGIAAYTMDNSYWGKYYVGAKRVY